MGFIVYHYNQREDVTLVSSIKMSITSLRDSPWNSEDPHLLCSLSLNICNNIFFKNLYVKFYTYLEDFLFVGKSKNILNFN